MDFETYLRDALEKEISEFRLSTRIQDGKTVFLIHPLNVHGLTLNFVVEGDTLFKIPTEHEQGMA